MSSFFCFILFLLLTCLREGSCDPPAPLLFFIARRQAMTKRLHGSGSAKAVFSVSVVEAEEAERRIAHMGPSMRNHILQYRIYYPNDPYLRVWTGIMFSQSGRYALAAAEFKGCLKNGLNSLRIYRYFNTAVSLCANSTVKS